MEINIGDRFGYLTVIEDSGMLLNGNNKRKYHYYKCRCDCGNVKLIDMSSLKKGHTKSCGCLSLKISKSKDKIDKYRYNIRSKMEKHIGERYGRLEIIDIVYDGRRNACVCKCDCGNIKNIQYYDLSSGKTSSCGCIQKEMMSKNSVSYLKNRKNVKWFFVKDGIEVRCRSGYEVLYANYLIENNIDFEYERHTYTCIDGKHYTPDFYLVKENKYIEIKGSFYNSHNQEEKIAEFSTHNTVDILYWEDLKDICGIEYSGYSGLLRCAYRRNIPKEIFLGNRLYQIK